KRRRGYVQERGDTGALERFGLRRATSCQKRERRPHVAKHRQLLLAQVGGNEAEDAYAPRARSETRASLLEKGAGFGAAHERQREKGKASSLGDGFDERGAIGYARHRTLDDGKLRSHRARERSLARER